MPEHIPFFRVFLSSPGDVNDERRAVIEILERLPNRPAFREKVGFRVIAWDKPGADTPMLATMSPQAAIDAGLPKPSECDIVVCIFWARMGTPFVMDGVSYLSGTHYELLDALSSKRPETILYRRDEKKLFEASDHDGQEQFNRVQTFFDGELFYDPATRQIRRGVNRYGSPADFREKFETHLEELVVRLLKRYERQPLPPAPEPPAASSILTIASKRWDGSPFPGLRPFTKNDAPIFFGRERETDSLLRRVAESRFVAVVGASGSGKSSLAGAGLLPRLEANAISDEATGSKDWFVVQFTPGQGEHPFAALFDAIVRTFEALRPSPFDLRRVKNQFVQDMLADPATVCDTLAAALDVVHAPPWAEALLFIDQFEELFTLAPAESVAPFARMLTEIARRPRLRVIATLRHDFVQRAVEIPELAELLNLASFHLSAPTHGALAQMIKRPAELAALEVEDGLAEQILGDMGHDGGALALMAYTLDELYKVADRRHDRRLTFADYAALGGVQGAVGQRAEETFQKLDLADKEALLGRVFRELVEVDERGTATRRRAPQGRFDGDALALVRAFTAARLLVVDADPSPTPPQSLGEGPEVGSVEVDRAGPVPTKPGASAGTTPALSGQPAESDPSPTPPQSLGEGPEVGSVEVAHEALFRSWARLSEWIAGAQEDLILLRQVRSAAHDWQAKRARNPQLDFSYLRWPAERLKLVADMALRLHPDLTDSERDFIEPEQNRLLREIEDLRTDHQRRRWIGERLATIGDPRSGIGVAALTLNPSPSGRGTSHPLRPEGEGGRGDEGVLLPQIDWLPVTGGAIEIAGIRFAVQPFYVARYLVTYRQFQAFRDAPDGFADERWWQGFPAEYVRQEMSSAVAQYDNYPRDSVSWYQCVAFSRWVDAKYRELGLFDGMVPPGMALTPGPSPSGRGEKGSDGRALSGRGEKESAGQALSGRGEKGSGDWAFSGRGDGGMTGGFGAGGAQRLLAEGEGNERVREMATQAMVHVARDLRQRETPAKDLLWQCLRDRRLDGMKFRRQHPVANTTYVVDFFCYEHKLVIELDGAVHAGQQEADRQRQAELEALGLQVLRFSNDQIFNHLASVLTTILHLSAFPFALRAKGPGDEGRWQIRLPTEWEWQWLAQNGAEERVFPWGAWDEHPRANTTEAGIGDRSTAVGMYPDGAAACGALDVAGNLWEWCLNDHAAPLKIDVRNNKQKVLRGGSFSLNQGLAAASSRFSYGPDFRYYYFGLRLAACPIASLPSESLNSGSL